MLLADIRPYLGWSWLVAVISGIVVAIVLFWAVAAVNSRARGRWPAWLLTGYSMALVGGMVYFLSVRFTAPRSVPAVLPPPPLWFVAELAGLSAVASTVVACTLLFLVLLAEIIAPGPVGRRVRAWRERRASATRHAGPVDERINARLRLQTPDGPAGRWLRGAIRVRPGSLVWEPANGVLGAPAELTSATIVPAGAGRDARNGRAITIDMPAGRIQLECAAELFALLQQIATELATGPPL